MSDGGLVVLETDKIRRQLFMYLGRPQSRIMIVTPFLQDVDLGNNRTIRSFLEQHSLARTEIELLTTPPALTKGAEFTRKFTLLESFAALGVTILLNDKLHAKAFCFNHEDILLVTMLGSANLTTSAMHRNLEMACFSARTAFYHSVMALVRIFCRHQDTVNFLVWRTRHGATIKTLLGGP